MSHAEAPTRMPWPRLLAMTVALAVAVGCILLAFAWPVVVAEPRDLPVGVVGDEAQVAQVEKQIADQADGAVALVDYDDRAAAVSAIERREAFGAVILGDGASAAPEVLVASAASPPVAQMLQGIAARMQGQVDDRIRAGIEEKLAQIPQQLQQAVQAALQAAAAGEPPAQSAPPAAPEIPDVQVKVTDVVPLADADERGAGLTVAMLPIVIGGMLGGVVLSLLTPGGVRRVVGVILYAALAGLVLAGVLQSWFGVLPGPFWVCVAVLALAVAAISATIAGLASLLGVAGIPLGAVLVLLVANPISAASFPVEFLPAPWGAIGQGMPPGAANTLLRDVSYFPAADATGPWLTLAIWVLVGLALALIPRRAAGARARVPAAGRSRSVERD